MRSLRLSCLLLTLTQCVFAQARPNFVFILVDDMGWSDLGIYGSDLHETPNIDAFAKRSMRFTNAYAASPVCSPTRASIMTGKYPARVRMTIWHEASKSPPMNRKVVPPVTVDSLPHAEVTIAEVLHQAGYATAHVGKWHLGSAAYYPQTQGFDYNIGGTFWGAPQDFFYPYSGTKYFSGGPLYVPHLGGGQTGEYLTDRLTSEAIEILEHEKDRPFYLNLAYHTVHTPIQGKPEIVKKYERKIKPGLRHRNAQYAAMVQSLDENVGRVLATLDKLGVADNTVVILTSDNGGFINKFEGQTVTDNAPLRSGKGSLYEGGIRVPAMIYWPGTTKPGAVSDVPISTVDYYRTILSIAGLAGDSEHNRNVDGVNLKPLLVNPAATLERAAMFFHYPHYYSTTTPVSAVRVGDWKLLEYYEDGRLELYNLANDLGETSNLADSQSARAEALHSRLRAWLKSVDAQLPEPNPSN